MGTRELTARAKKRKVNLILRLSSRTKDWRLTWDVMEFWLQGTGRWMLAEWSRGMAETNIWSTKEK